VPHSLSGAVVEWAVDRLVSDGGPGFGGFLDWDHVLVFSNIILGGRSFPPWPSFFT
jgi:hypothetical protein